MNKKDNRTKDKFSISQAAHKLETFGFAVRGQTIYGKYATGTSNGGCAALSFLITRHSYKYLKDMGAPK